ncbi:DoxX family protein [cf. Phormidesmis sp. LEGE 11477]|uniref:DoxX family protein n=1 Tax=cf. Phormidesmis sp. LEGE 11477 TaxID=1828680 RepID=UPI001880194C|nr:DoxX family protein [cf. Phormidesmis sp. LEGE 11477]MBE9063650.1 DoxX family protein [cf. Phormidesmis sp. LEGE 11477]
MQYLPLAARICLALIFLNSGINKLLDFPGLVDTISQTLPLAGLLAVGTIVFQLVGAIFLVLGYKVKIGATLLILFLIPASLVFHNFLADPSQINSFLKNVGLIGGLLMVIYTGPGRISMDKGMSA